MIKGTEDTRYAYVNGIIRALEARLLTKGHFDRLIAADTGSYNTILSDTPYIGGGDLESGLESEEKAVRGFFEAFCLTDEVRSFLEWPEQVHNLKVRLKGGTDDLLYAQDTGTVETWPEVIEEVSRFAVDKTRSFFPPILIRYCVDIYMRDLVLYLFFSTIFSSILNLRMSVVFSGLGSLRTNVPF